METLASIAQQEKDAKRKGFIITLLVHLLLGLLAFFLLKLYPPDPPIPDTGIAINFGDSPVGSGEKQPETKPDKVDLNKPDPAPQKSNPQTVKAPAPDLIKSTDVESVNIKSKPNSKEEKKPKEIKEEKPQPEQPKLDSRLNYTGKKPGGAAPSSEGDDRLPGDQGDPDGDKKSPSRSGTTGSSGGISYDLNGRGHVSLPKPVYNSEKTGRVVVDIVVDNEGKVVRATPGAPGTNVQDPALWRSAQEAAMRARFQPISSGPTAYGTMTYVFMRN